MHWPAISGRKGSACAPAAPFRTSHEKNGRTVVRLDNGSTIETLTADQLLVATGRRANTRGLGLEAAGVQVGHRGEKLSCCAA